MHPVAREHDIGDAVPLHHAGRQHIQRAREGPDRTCGIAAQQKDLVHPGLVRHAGEKIVRLGEAGQVSGDHMRHRNEPGLSQAFAGGDDVVMRDAGWVVHEHRGAWIEQPA
jgi:hypothetical protein